MNDSRALFRLLILSIFFSTYAFSFETRASAPASTARSPVKVFVPSTAEPGVHFPLVLLLHGYMGNQNLIETYFGYQAQVDKRKFILVVPNGLKNQLGLRYWNASPACCDFDHALNDDVRYLKGLLTEAFSKYAVDRSRVFVVGHSNGGFMAHRLACDASELISGIISFAGVGPLDAADCNPRRPVSVLQIHAEDDDTIRFKGDEQGYEGLEGYPGAEDTVTRWMERDRCESKREKQAIFDLTLSIPGPDTTMVRSAKCAGEVTVEFWKIQPFQSWIHSPHTPLLRDEFTERTLDFIFSHPRSEN